MRALEGFILLGLLLLPIAFAILLICIGVYLTKSGKKTQDYPGYPQPTQHPQGYTFDHPDPERWFSPEQRRAGHRRAGGQCEYTDIRTGRRCINKSREADHFYPYSRGGATSMRNLVVACIYHNQTKSYYIWEHERGVIQARRKDYFPEGEDVAVGEWKWGAPYPRNRRRRY